MDKIRDEVRRFVLVVGAIGGMSYLESVTKQNTVRGIVTCLVALWLAGSGSENK